MVRRERPWPAEGSRALRTGFSGSLSPIDPSSPSTVFCLLFSDLSAITRYREHCQFHDQQTSHVELERKCDLLRKRDIETAVQKNDNLMRKRKRCGEDEDVEDVLKEWFLKVRANDARFSGPLHRQKSEDLPNQREWPPLNILVYFPKKVLFPLPPHG
ncbi:hypothetical protein AVEN_221033-1 [Araneus ventricosus]|uniref:Uncharacterized protein n=1 Tax=Araneus ventricosus TaxID=182803 RepID=A0A4Y2PK91_ARAVE|nr:hypothetical protein AVEN_182961-1 [Araneus ventricosus]GBN50627.1 hypothetical protein AVEN_221033-1 [Araneus ventricosus]